ncbi:uncharacterized protein At4g19900 isoform X1 [Syzygium oleosum]|uniref:uncharacterized protein At4g19900 isoform X1 n=2 Tax=Syzygium oleosum TaxID=219896 RepID=UPI0024B9610B|nr:uncharacterized protein At4g19900 isoform X1 [Syzygium oleosum]
MLRSPRSRRRPRCGAHACALISAVLLLLSVSLLYSRLSSATSAASAADAVSGRVLSDPAAESVDRLAEQQLGGDDKIDELDIVEEEEEADRGGAANSRWESEDQGEDDDDDEEAEADRSTAADKNYFYDHATGSIRRAFSKRSIDEWDYDGSVLGVGSIPDDRSKTAFGSDDMPVDEGLRRKVTEVTSVEDALLLKVNKRVSPLREGWGDWFDKKSEFLRKDRMFRSSLDILNPSNNPMLQDPDGVGVTGYTRGDRLVQKWWLNEFRKVPFSVKKPLGISEDAREARLRENNDVASSRKTGSAMSQDSEFERRGEIRRAERRTLDDNMRNVSNSVVKTDGSEANGRGDSNLSGKNSQSAAIQENRRSSEIEGHVYADGRRWGYYPGLHPGLSFTEFMNAFFRTGRCHLRVFMVWNSPPWMFSVRHQRALESLLSQHPDACVVVFSETIELDFFRDSFLKDGYKVAVAMPNLEELLKDTPTFIFASVWFEWRKTKLYPTHFSELIRLAALYKYGGIYIDFDVIVLKSLSSLNNTVGLESQLDRQSLNGAVMAFRRHSPFIMECLREFYSVYDDTQFRWNGADLLTRVAENFSRIGRREVEPLELKVQLFFVFFPISSQDITRYFVAPSTEIERGQQDSLFRKILDESLTFHFWNSVTSTLVPEPGSLVTRLIDHRCIHCFDVL